MGKRTNTAKWEEKYNRWKINVQKDGERKSFYSSTPGRNGQREANAKADAWLDDGINGGNTRVSALYNDYVENLKRTTSRSNWSKVVSYGKNWILPEIGDKRISKLSEQQLQNIINKGFAANLSKKTLTCLRGTLVSFIKYCRKQKATTLLPEDLSVPKGAKVKEKHILQPEALSKLFNSDLTLFRKKLIPDKNINAYRFQVLTGLRPGELMGLQWENIKGNLLYVRRSINYYGETTSGKNENAVRHFALSSIALKVLEDQKKYTTHGTIFPLSNMQTYLKQWKRYCEANGIPQITLYEMRHTFVSIAKNLPEGQVKTLVGHSKNMDTFGTYGHELQGELKKTADEIDAIFHSVIENPKK